MWKYVTFLTIDRFFWAKAAIFACSLLILFRPADAAEMRELELDLGGKTYRIELALTSSERRLGLMFRESLASDAGMLLVYRDSGDHHIWMKNVNFPLQVYWINSFFEVVDKQRLEPCSKDPCPVFSAAHHSRFVLELSDDSHGLTPGDVIEELSDL